MCDYAKQYEITIIALITEEQQNINNTTGFLLKCFE